MKISTKGRYGLRTMVDIALNSPGSYTPLSVVAERQEVSENYLEHVFATLRKSGLVRSEKGAQGGYALAGEPSKISVKDILNALEGDLSIVDIDENNCSVMDSFLNEYVWKKVDKSIDDIVSSYSMHDLVLEYQNIKDNKNIMYYI